MPSCDIEWPAPEADLIPASVRPSHHCTLPADHAGPHLCPCAAWLRAEVPA